MSKNPILSAFGLFILAALVVGCARRLPDAEICNTDDECEAGMICLDSVCTTLNDTQTVPCTTDETCNEGEACTNGACTSLGSTASGGACSTVAECAMDQFCNTSTGQCQALLDGWCRQASQCLADSPICSAPDANSLGRCVECLRDADCGNGGRCVQPGICEAGGSGGIPPDNGGGGTDPGAGSPDAGPGGGGVDPGTGDVCQDNGWYGDGSCDANCPQPDPDCDGTDPGTGGGLGDICQDLGWYGDGLCDDFCPNPDPDCTGGGGGAGGGTGGTGTADFCEDYGWYGDGFCDDDCPQPDPDCGGAGGIDECADNNWYGDGICDTFCPNPDPDCTTGGGGTGALGENEACVTQDGQMLDCADGLDCIAVSDANGFPLYGSCKQICNTDGECGGRSCALGFLADGSGVCGSPLTAGQSGCSFWDQGDSFCFDPNAPTGEGSAFLDCLSGTCQYICDYDGNVDGAWQCPAGSCSNSFSTYSGYNVDLAVCQ